MIAETIVVQISLRFMRGSVGAPGSVPGATARLLAWVRTPNGSTANSTIHQMTK